LHRLANRGQQLGREGVQVDLLVHAGAEGRDGLGGVVAAAVEAPVDRGLDAAVGWPGQCGHGKGRAGHDQAGTLAQELAQAEDDEGVPATQQHRQQAVGERAADDPVQVVQPVAQDRRPDRQRQQDQAHPGAPGDQGQGQRRAGRQRGAGQHQGRAYRGQAGGERQPAELLAFQPAGTAEPHRQRDTRDRHGQQDDGARQQIDHEQRHLDRQAAGEPERVDDRLVGRVQRLGNNATVTRNASGAAPRALAHQRQRRDGDGSDPLGVSSSTKPAQASPAMKTAGLYTAR
jgi:hypothetical protein